jgi:hypothetical protein
VLNVTAARSHLSPDSRVNREFAGFGLAENVAQSQVEGRAVRRKPGGALPAVSSLTYSPIASRLHAVMCFVFCFFLFFFEKKKKKKNFTFGRKGTVEPAF